MQQSAKKKYKTKYDCVGKVFYKKLCKRSDFEFVDTWYMHKPESALK